MPRLFVALEIPGSIADALASLRGGLPSARWIDRENYHITLRFIGDIDHRTAGEVVQVLDGIRREPFEVDIRGLDSFGGRKPRALFASVASSPQLTALQADIERRMQMIGLPPESRRFTPHVTIARLRGATGPGVAGYLGSRGLFHPGSFTVDRFVLYSARDSRGGGPYIVEEEYPFDGALAVA